MAEWKSSIWVLDFAEPLRKSWSCLPPRLYDTQDHLKPLFKSLLVSPLTYSQMQPKLVCLGRHLFQWSVVKSWITSELNGKKHQFIISQLCRLIVPSWAVITWDLRGGCTNLEAGTCSHVKVQLGQMSQVTHWCAVAWELNWGCQPSCLFMASTCGFSIMEPLAPRVSTCGFSIMESKSCFLALKKKDLRKPVFLCPDMNVESCRTDYHQLLSYNQGTILVWKNSQ